MPAFDAAHRPAETDAHGLWRLDPDHERVRRDDPDAARAQVFGKAGARPRIGPLQTQMETTRMRGRFGSTQANCAESLTLVRFGAYRTKCTSAGADADTDGRGRRGWGRRQQGRGRA